MTPKAIITNTLIFLYIIISAIFTFAYQLDLDKYIGISITIAFTLSTTVQIIHNKLKKRKTAIDSLTLIGASSLILVYITQYIKYEILINIEALTLFAITGTIYFANTIKTHINSDKALLFLATTFLASSILTINKDSGYIFETGAGGILSAFILLLTFLASHKVNNLFAKIISATSLLLTIAISIRATLISAVIYAISKSTKTKSLIAAAICGSVLAAIYLLNPESRIFELHTSGRLIHWDIIISKFNPSNFIYGMGAHSSTNILLDLGLEESMAAPHNEYIRYTYDLGLLGAISLACILGALYKSSPPENKVFTLILALQMFTDNVFTYYFNYLIFFIILCTLPTKSKSQKTYELKRI